MLLTITLAQAPATDLGFLLGKHPDRVHRTELAFGHATVCFPQADVERCTAALIVEVDPIGLVRRSDPSGSPGGFTLGQHINDRPYAASSLLSVAISRALGSALHGRSRERPELAAAALPLELAVPAVRDSDGLAARLFGPLGWAVDCTPVGPRHVDLRLIGAARLTDALTAVYVLLPVLDDAKHHYVGPDEVDKLMRAGEGWLADHPERELITRRYLRYRRRLTAPLLERLGIGAEGETPPTPLRELRRRAVLAELHAAGARRVLDLGCGDGALLAELLRDTSVTEIVGIDTSVTSLDRAARRLRLDELPPAARSRITLRQSSLTYTDRGLAGYDAAVLSEVVEHVDPDRLTSLEQGVFAVARPATVVVTTPNREYNARYPNLAPGAFRHPDHRFEWTRAEFAAWAERVGTTHGYRVRYAGVGDPDVTLGTPTQLAAFTRKGE
ncbi:MAG: 3' terminal RNA ribose 2'-O-methyltransferase Hen1 [Pseudonocardia sp.]